MPKLPILSGQQVVNILTKHFNFFFVAQKGSHIKLRKIVSQKIIITIVPNHKELARGTLKGLLDLAEVDTQEFIKFC